MRAEKGGLSKVYQGVCAGEEAAFKTVTTEGKGASTDIACLISERQRLEDLAKLAGGGANIRERGFLPLYHASTNTQQPATLVEGEGDEATKRPIIVLVTPWVSSGDDSGKYEFIEIMAAISKYNFRKISQKHTAPLSAPADAQAKEEVLIGIRAICLFIHAHITASNALLYALDNMASDVFLKWSALLDRGEKRLQVVGLTPHAAPPETAVLRWVAICGATETRGAEKEEVRSMVNEMKTAMKKRGTMTEEGEAVFISRKAVSWGVGQILRHFVSGDSHPMASMVIHQLDAALKQARREGRPAEEAQELEKKMKREKLICDLKDCLEWESFLPKLFDNGLGRSFRKSVKLLHERGETEMEWSREIAEDISRLAYAALQEDPEKRPGLEAILRTILEVERRLSDEAKQPTGSSESGISGRVPSSGIGQTGSLPSCLEMPSCASKPPPPVTEMMREAMMAAESDEVTLQQQQQQQQQQYQQEAAANNARARWNIGCFLKRLWSRRVQPAAEYSDVADEENWSLVETQEAEDWMEHERRREAEEWQWVVFEAAMEGGV
ncbi:unnamed protein product [Vitrella brassicaformis CCMP3155]|uniref:Protein kinase domain-containing protein n=1 Tax=Vitrella brassicaformis (strain CCMP3155) TaxID=1169540 RepID=A0A0G4FRJ6_VITBC|nr:unnamed protein product [Vitrella brassicaformis CCMP3155]|eukprot:CEM16722.1 unnamed protein product [Vitrella brassicaformis CCMP3155]